MRRHTSTRTQLPRHCFALPARGTSGEWVRDPVDRPPPAPGTIGEIRYGQTVVVDALGDVPEHGGPWLGVIEAIHQDDEAVDVGFYARLPPSCGFPASSNDGISGFVDVIRVPVDAITALPYPSGGHRFVVPGNGEERLCSLHNLEESLHVSGGMKLGRTYNNHDGLAWKPPHYRTDGKRPAAMTLTDDREGVVWASFDGEGENPNQMWHLTSDGMLYAAVRSCLCC